jgi:hypothetical protein
MFSLYAHEVEPEQRFEAATSVSRLAVAGQAGMMALYNQIVDRNLDSGAFPIGTRVHITMLAELMDESAAFGLQSDMWDDSELRQRCAGIGWQAQSASHPRDGTGRSNSRRFPDRTRRNTMASGNIPAQDSRLCDVQLNFSLE